VVTEIEERRNYIIRKSVNLSKEAHIVASNIDQAILLVTLKLPSTSFGFVDRFLVTAEAYGVPVIIAFNKIDLLTEEDLKVLEHWEQIYRTIGYECIRISAQEGTGLDTLKEMMQYKESLISGHSGAGKSTLINAIQPGLELRTAEVSKSHSKGQHTTTFAEMFPLDFGGFIIDTPGIKGFGLVDIDKDNMSHYFPEMFALLSDCKFHNCKHMNEPGCAVKVAVANGEIAESRYTSYLNLVLYENDSPYR
jgi:ribosome biogenesis GTPase